MSHQYYNSIWAEAQQEYRAILQDERRGIPDVELADQVKLFEYLADLYIKYVGVFKKLDSTYDQIVHPQKRPLLRRLLDFAIVRMLEIREAMGDVELSNFVYFDDILQWMHWVPEDYDINTPKYYIYERGPEFALREEWLETAHTKRLSEDEAAFAVVKDSDDEASLFYKSEFEEEIGISTERAVRLIQTAERARQGQARYEMAKFIFEEEEKVRGKKKRQKQQLMDPVRAIIIMQRAVRRFISYRRVQRRRNEELEFLGLNFSRHRTNTIMGRKITQANEWRKKIQAHAERRRQVQRHFQQDFENAQAIAGNRLRILEAPEMLQDMKTQLRTWLIDVKERTGKFPDVPKPDLTGSGFDFPFGGDMDQMTVFSEKAPSPSVQGSTGKKKGKKSKESKSDKETKKTKGASSTQEPHPEQLGYNPPRHFEKMVEANLEYNLNWRLRDELHNPDQRHEDAIILNSKRELMESEVRAQVDTLMKAELQILREAVEKRKGKKSKKQKKSGRGSKGGKKGKKKKKRTKDLTPDRTLESLFTELVVNGIIRKYPKVSFQDLVGECSLVNGTIRRHHCTAAGTFDEPERPNFPKNPHPPPSFGDIKRAIKDICVLPMGSLTVHQLAPFTKSVLICGPEGSGKKSLIHAVCTELNATLFDLTPASIAGKYPGKPGLNMLMHLIAKVGRLCQPTILFIDDVEKTYQKRVPKTDRTEPKRLKRHLAKFIKSIGADDQIMLIATSSEPWAANIKILKKDYQKILYIPKPDHGDRVGMWKDLLAPHSNEIHQDVQLSLLAKLSDGWTLGAISGVVKTVTQKHYDALDRDRRYRSQSSGKDQKIVKIGRKLIRIDDILFELSMLDPLFLEQEKLWNNWFNKTPLQRARIMAIEKKLEHEKPKSKGNSRIRRHVKFQFVPPQVTSWQEHVQAFG